MRVSLNLSQADIAAMHFLDDVPGAMITGSRIHGILLKIVTGGPLTIIQEEYLRQHGYDALLRLALGELDDEGFRILAQAEQESRLLASVVAKEKEVADKRAWLEASNRKNAALFADRRRRQEARAIYDRFGQPYIEHEHYGRVTRILRSVTAGKQIKKDDLLWLGTVGVEYWTSELRKAHHENLARTLSDEWRRTGDVWKAINACGQWRKAGMPEDGLKVAQAALEGASSPKSRSALLTTGGGALRDLRRLEAASEFGSNAHSLAPQDFRPCTLLGAVHIEMGDYLAGADWYEKAEARGASRNSINQELQSILDAAPAAERKRIENALKSHNSSRYNWL